MAALVDKKRTLSPELRALFDSLPSELPPPDVKAARLPAPLRKAQAFYSTTMTLKFYGNFLKIILVPLALAIFLEWFYSGLTSSSVGVRISQIVTLIAIGTFGFLIDSGRYSTKMAMRATNSLFITIFLVSLFWTQSYNELRLSSCYIRILAEAMIVMLMSVDILKKNVFLSLHIGIGTLYVFYRQNLEFSGHFPILILMGACLSIIMGISYFLAQMFNENFLKTAHLYRSEQATNRILRSVIPDSVVDELNGRSPGTSLVRRYDSATVLFADLVGFTQFCAESEPEVIVEVLNQVFSRFDASVKHLGLEKIKTIGDAYLAVGGLPHALPNHPQKMVDLALELRAAIEKYNSLTGMKLQIRIGVHTGPVVAGIIGRDRFTYDLWGDTVNIASRLESTGSPGEIHISQATADLVVDEYRLSNFRTVNVKGRGEIRTCFVEGPKAFGPDIKQVA